MGPALILALLAGVPAESTVRGAHVTASLLAEQAWIRPGRPLTVGLRLQMDPEWHTYWKNPGDSGLPTRIRWTLPVGFEAGAIAWPSPERFAAEPLASYGYAGEVVLLSEIHVPAQAPLGSAVVIAARADWLECRDVCRPGKAELALRLDVKDEEPRRDDRWAMAFAEARARMPRERASWTIAGDAGRGALTLLARGAATPPRQAYFFPGRPDVVEHGAPQHLAAQKGGFRLEIPLAANAKPPESLEGVLVADGVGYELTAAIRPSTAKGETR
jgi:thiol:disulfide interchange protein DsbD